MKKHNLNLSFNTKFDAITDTTWVRDILKWDYKIEDFFMGSFIHEHHNIERIRDDASWKESKYIEYLSAFSIRRAFKILCQPNWLEFNYIIEPAFKVNR